ncbi:MAG: SusD/RagB family nutrient-binding outer membrane lipoprotein [Saprospiraceae bacterium]
MGKIKNMLVLGLVLSLTYSCESVVADLNNDPNNLTDVPVGLMINHIVLNTASVAEADPARITAMWADQMTGSDRQYISYDNYNILSSDFDAIWADIYQSGVAQAKIAEEKALTDGNAEYAGVAQIIRAYYFGEAAALFGNVPFSEVGDFTSFPDPKYDNQLTVFSGVQELLTKGAGNVIDFKNGFGIYETSSSWKSIASALSARYHLLTGNYSAALSAAEAAAFDTPASSVNITHSTSNYSENLFWQFAVEQRDGYLTFGDSYMSKILSSDNAAYRGNSKTDETARKAYYITDDLLNTSSGAFAIDASFPLISFEEVQLIIAECAVRAGDLDKAITALNNVRAAWDARLGGGLYVDYMLTDFATGGIANTQSESQEDALLREILEEKYLSVIGLPTFYDVNRTKNFLGVSTDRTENSIAQRFIYPSSEESSNANFPGLVDLFVPTPVNE